jgi:hypothetical protein
MKWCTEKDVDSEIRALVKEGYRVTEGRHIKVKAPCGHTVTISRSPSDWRAIRKIRADIRHMREAQAKATHGK